VAVVHYTFTHKQYTEQQLIWEECGPCPVVASYMHDCEALLHDSQDCIV